MTQTMPFGEVLEAADQLSLDEQKVLVDILHRRLTQSGRQRSIAEVQEANQDYAAGQCRPVTLDTGTALDRLLDTAYQAECESDSSPMITLEQVRDGLSSIPGNMAADISAERDER